MKIRNKLCSIRDTTSAAGQADTSSQNHRVAFSGDTTQPTIHVNINQARKVVPAVWCQNSVLIPFMKARMNRGRRKSEARWFKEVLQTTAAAAAASPKAKELSFVPFF